jgi:HSP20 family molecular chaperone IbpA
MPFLSHVLPPPDSWIQVESTHSEYKLLVRLPGFSREGITLASKRRRILHIVADSWENGGGECFCLSILPLKITVLMHSFVDFSGHFERRISFGYDADLAQVRAEFDGVMLRIAIPRRVSPITWNANASSRMGRI